MKAEIGKKLRGLQKHYSESRARRFLFDRFEAFHGRSPELNNPKRFSDKVFARILAPADPFYSVLAYKHLAPFFVKSRCPSIVIPRKLKVRKTITPSDFDSLPDAFVIKSSYGSGMNTIVRNKRELDIPRVCERFNKQLSDVRNAQMAVGELNCIVFEELLGDGNIPNDIKIHVFNSGPPIVQVDSEREHNHHQSLFDGDKWLPFIDEGRQRHDERPAVPENLPSLVANARALAEGFDYLRVDLYSVNGNIVFGELTPFHMAALFKFTDPAADEWIGSRWNQTFPMIGMYPD